MLLKAFDGGELFEALLANHVIIAVHEMTTLVFKGFEDQLASSTFDHIGEVNAVSCMGRDIAGVGENIGAE